MKYSVRSELKMKSKNVGLRCHPHRCRPQGAYFLNGVLTYSTTLSWPDGPVWVLVTIQRSKANRFLCHILFGARYTSDKGSFEAHVQRTIFSDGGCLEFYKATKHNLQYFS